MSTQHAHYMLIFFVLAENPSGFKFYGVTHAYSYGLLLYPSLSYTAFAYASGELCEMLHNFFVLPLYPLIPVGGSRYTSVSSTFMRKESDFDVKRLLRH